MPALTTAEETLIRTAPPVLKYYLAVMPYVVKFKCSLNDSTATWGLYQLIYDGVTYGAYGDIEGGETLHVWDSTETIYKGRVRVRSATSNVITVGANNDIEYADDDILIVYNVWEPWSRPTNQAIVSDVTTYYKDWDITFTDQATSFPPKANATPAFAGFLGSGGYVDVDFVSTSIPMAGATIASVAWDIGDGTYQTGDSSSTTIVARFSSPGFRWVKLTATDSNGKTGVMRVPVWTFGGGYEPEYNIEVRRRSFDVRDGQVDLEIYETDLGTTDIFEGAQVVLFSREWINGVEVTQDMGSFFPGRRQIRFNGWILRDTVDWNPEAGSVSFSVGTIGKAADNLPGYGTFLQDVGTAEDWHKLEDLTVRTAMHFVLEWQTNLPTIAFIEYLNSSATDPGPYIGGREFTAAPPLKQLEQALLKPRGVFVRCGCTRWGSIHFRYDPQELNETDRGYVPHVTNILRTDRYNELSIARSTRPKVNSVWGGGIYYDGSTATPYRARSPGKIGREAAKRDRADHLIITGQTQLNELLGAYLGELSLEWDTVKPELAWDIWEPALQETTSLAVEASENPRGYTFTAADLWLIRRLDIKDIQAGAPEVQLELELLADPLQGVTVAIPDPPDFRTPEYPGPREWGPPEDPGLDGKVIIAGTTDAGVIWTADIDQIYPTWAKVGTGIGTAEVLRVAQNPQNNRELVALVKTAGWDNSDYGDLYYTSNYRDSGVAWVKIVDGGDMWTANQTVESGLGRTLGVDGYFRELFITADGVLVAGFSMDTSSANPGYKYIKSTDWNTVAPCTITFGDLLIGNDSFWPRYWERVQTQEMSTAGKFVMLGENGTGSGAEHQRGVSTDYCMSWTFPGTEKTGNLGGDNGISPIGIIGDGTDVWVSMWWLSTDNWEMSKWAGGEYTGATQVKQFLETDWSKSSNDFGTDRQLLLSNTSGGSLYFAETTWVLAPVTKYGDTYIYLASGWPTQWNTATLDIAGTTLDNFRGNPGQVLPMNRIIIGNGRDYVASPSGPGDHSIYLLTAAGTTVANKSGTGVTGVAGLGATIINHVIWDQYED